MPVSSAEHDDAALERLEACLKELDSLAVCFSGGVDSTFLAAVAARVLGERLLCITAVSPTYPAHEREEAVELARQLGLRHRLIDSDELQIPGFADNPPDRCYFCKGELFSIVKEIAAGEGIGHVADGSTLDDLSDYRPGRKAAAELGVVSPLLEAEMDKECVRRLSRRIKLPTADKPAYACLASRFPYGDRITAEKLQAVEILEELLHKLGFLQVRVRCHQNIARIEALPEQLSALLEPESRAKISAAAHEQGFLYVTLDLDGYRTGSMNAVLS